MGTFDYSLNLYHPEKDKMPGAYEWWYFDGDLHNGYSFNVVFSCTNPTALRYAQALGKLAADPTIPYNALDYATMKVGLYDEKRVPIFYGELDLNADQVKIASDRLDVWFGDTNHLTMRETGGLPEFVIDAAIPDGKGKTIKADVVLSPMVPGVKIGRGALIEKDTPKGHLFHRWIVAVPNGQVKASFKVTDSEGKVTAVSDSGYSYHDHNWGNHPLPATLEKWYWGRIAEGDMNMIYSKVYNLFPEYPPFKPCIFVHGKDIITSTEDIDFIEDKMVTGAQELTYASEGRLIFLEGSGVKGEVKIGNLQMVAEQLCYLRFAGDYSMDVETSIGRIKRDGRTMFEYMDLAAAVRLRQKLAAQQK